jgi:hypothetical protein
VLLYPNVPVCTSTAGTSSPVLSLVGVPQLVVRDLATPVRSRTPPPASALSLATNEPDGASQAHRRRLSPVPSLSDLLAEEEHEVTICCRRVRRRRAVESASKLQRSRRLAAKEAAG